MGAVSRLVTAALLAVALLACACSDDGGDAALPTTAPTSTTAAPLPTSTSTTVPTTPPPTDARLPAAADFELGFTDLSYAPTDCAGTTGTTGVAGATYLGGPAGPLVTIELLVPGDDDADDVAAALRDDPACIGFADEHDAAGTVVEVHDDTVVLATVQLHQGADIVDVWSDALTALVVERLVEVDRASTAVRLACRRFYGVDPSVDDDPDVVLTEPQLVERCDAPAIEWRDDCYADRPPRFVVRDGGCAHLGGYLAVWAGTRADARSDQRFSVDGTTWTIFPESD